MSRQRVPWWLYVVAASFCGYFALVVYVDFWGPTRVGIEVVYKDGRMVLRDVLPNSAGARAGLRADDRVVSVEGQHIRGGRDWVRVASNFEVGIPRRFEIERGSKNLEVVLTLGRRPLQWPDPASLTLYAGRVICLLLAFVVAFSRSHDSVALLGSWLLAAISTLGEPWYGFAAPWRHLPAPIGILLWIAFASGVLVAVIFFTFFAVFPRKLFRSRWPLSVAWALGLAAVLPDFLEVYQQVYAPEHVTGMWEKLFSLPFPSWLVFLAAGLIALAVNYRRLEDLNEKRRIRVLVVGTSVGSLGYIPFPLFLYFIPPRFGNIFFSSPAPIVCAFLFLLMPLSFAYALLRHRLFDIRVILRQGLQYALARRVVLAAVPLLAALLLLDLWLHADQPLAAILRARGWVYVGLAGLALLAHTQRRKWLESLDRRFFRERYDAQRLLREVVEDVRGAQSFERMAPGVVARIEAALHPEFAALLVREPREPAYRALAVTPAGRQFPALPAHSKLMALVRLLGKPLEMPHTDSGWLQQKLPHEETEFLRQARIDLLVPVAASPERTEALLVLGGKRSEEPYSGEDQDLLVAVAASLAILLEKPPAEGVPRRDVFEECPKCGACYDSGITRCARDSTTLVRVALPRLLAGRYQVERRLGRGGMGTVYEASDMALERRVAVKMIRDDLLGSAEAAERFRQEARVAAAFAHPNVVTVHDFGLVANTRAFLVMELLQGVTLRQELHKEKSLPPRRTLAILRGVCAAVEAAHQRQLLHRDLKPENIFLVRGDSRETPKVLDFGVAKFLPSATEEATVDTGTGVLVGTLQYMSPEQLRGDPAAPAWDLWALAVVAYEMLTGAHPYAERTAAELCRAAADGRFIPVTERLPEAGSRWQKFFEHALAPTLEQRPLSAKLFLAEFESALA